MISIAGQYTDNVYNINFDEQTNFLTTISPSIWLITPKAERLPVRLSSYNTAVGGSRFSLPTSGSFDRFQAYLLGGLNYNNYSLDSDLNYTAWNIEGLFQYKLPAGISFRIMDKFVDDRDRIDISSFLPQDFTVVDEEIYFTSETPSRIREFISNQAKGSINLDVSEKFAGYVDYTNYYLDYDDPLNDWLDRMDNVLSLYLFYQHSPKTSLFIQYTNTITEYETATWNDNKDVLLYGGVKWNYSVKTSLMLKGGYQVKKYESGVRDELATINENNEIADLDTFTMEAWFNYFYSEKTKMSFKLAKALEETDTILSRGKDTITGRFYYDHKFSERIRGYLTLRYEYYDYEEFYLADVKRKDQFIGVRPAVQYDFQKWLMAELAYSFEQRESNIDLYDFTTQTIFLSLNAAF
jgi:hypothetical protein